MDNNQQMASLQGQVPPTIDIARMRAAYLKYAISSQESGEQPVPFIDFVRQSLQQQMPQGMMSQQR